MWVERITCAPAVTGRVLLDATAHLTWGVPGECDDVKGVEHAGCVLGAGQGDGGLAVPGRDPASRFAPPRGNLRSSPVEWCNRFVSFGLGYALSWSGVSSCWVGWGVSRDLVRMSRLR